MKQWNSRFSFLFYLPLLFILITSGNVYSQLISIPYMCGFEDSTENGNWHLNYGPEGIGCHDQWMIGLGARSEGRSGLYISTDNATARYGAYANTVVAWREFSVPDRMPYDISFDWMNNGAPGTSELYVLLLMQSDTKVESDSTSSYIISGPGDIVNQRRVTSSSLTGNPQWKNYSFTESLQPTRTYTLMFIWSNNNRDTTLTNPIGGCIDNIQIASTWCPKPTNFNVAGSCDTTRLSWKGASTYYEAEYKQRGNYQWRKLGVQSDNFLEIVNLPEGMYDFRVRSICVGDTSAYATVSSVVIFCPDDHCINFVELTDPNIVTAYYGSATNPTQYQGVVDVGSQNVASRHVVNWGQDEFDPRTKNRLRTIPIGSYASVRLGNWAAGAQGEALDYKFYVDSAHSILLMQYAIVLEDPGHSTKEQPHFLLEILDENGYLIDPTCGKVDFYADKTRPGWQDGTGQVTWKDWTVVGLNLELYVGQTLTIRLVTRDCTPSAHYGYAYFTLDCASATIETNSCGDNPEMSISAPDGFSYTWTNPTYPDSIWYTKELEIPATDTTTYYCKVCYLEQSSCCFELSTQIFPRFPIADFGYEIVHEKCRTVVHFKNKSHVMTRFDGNEVHTSELCNMHFWDFGNGQSSPVFDPQLVCKNEGEVLNVTLTAYLGDCPKDTTIEIRIPAIGETLDLEEGEVCYGDSYIFADGRQYLMAGGTYYDTVPSICTGCDSITKLELTVHPQYNDPEVLDTICFGEYRDFGGKKFNTTKKHEVWLKSQYGCDSILTLNLYVRDEITFRLEGTDVLEGPNTGKIEIKDPSLSNYTYTINDQLNGSLTGLSGGVYTIVLYNEYDCPSEPQKITIMQDCLEIEMGESPPICANDPSFEMSYEIGKGFPTTYDILFSEKAQAAGFNDLLSLPADGTPITIPLPTDVRPDVYEMNIAFEDLLCDTLYNLVSFTVRYDSVITEQKWNDVIAILNSTYNGGYEFSAYQWYKDGSPMFGETRSYIYIENSTLDYDAEYSVLLTRLDDGALLFSCPIKPQFRNSQISLYPLVLNKQDQATLMVPYSGQVTVYDSMGRKQKSFEAHADMEMKFRVSEKEGYYVVIVQLDNNVQESFKMIVK